MTVSPKLTHTKAHFERSRKTQEEFISSLVSLCRHSDKRIIKISKQQQETLCEMAFVILFTAWEQFLENTFESLVIDAPASSFRKRQRVMVVDVETVHNLIRGNRPFAEWADPSQVKERAKVFFRNGEPFESMLSAVHDDLNKMRIIRNRCVHFSQHAAEQYQKMLRQVFGTGSRISPGRLLLNSPPNGLSSASNAQSYTTVFQLYGAILSTAASQIVPEARR
jgi:hypothetical protein